MQYYFAITLKESGKVIGEIDAYPETAEPHDPDGTPLYENTMQYAILKKNGIKHASATKKTPQFQQIYLPPLWCLLIYCSYPSNPPTTSVDTPSMFLCFPHASFPTFPVQYPK